MIMEASLLAVGLDVVQEAVDMRSTYTTLLSGSL